MDGVEVVHSLEHWQGVADRLRSGRVLFSTGHQERTAGRLADFIESAVEYADADEQGRLTLSLDWDSALSVAQAG